MQTLTLINPLALVNNPNVVCLDASEPTGTKSFNFSRQCLRWALLQARGNTLSNFRSTSNLLRAGIPLVQSNTFSFYMCSQMRLHSYSVGPICKWCCEHHSGEHWYKINYYIVNIEMSINEPHLPPPHHTHTNLSSESTIPPNWCNDINQMDHQTDGLTGQY